MKRLLNALPLAVALCCMAGCPEEETKPPHEGQTACGEDWCDDATENCVEGVCVAKNHCEPACANATPDCVDNVCRCNETSCEEGQLCNTEGACENTCVPACEGTTPVCVGTTCECDATSCGENAACENGVCVPVCEPACEGATPQCVAGGLCECTATSCGEGENCYQGACVANLCDPACDPASETPLCAVDVCKCSPYSCPSGSFCDESGACAEAVCEPACEEPLVCDKSGEADACVRAGDTCGVTIPLELGSPMEGDIAEAANLTGVLSSACEEKLGGFLSDVNGPGMLYRTRPVADGDFGVKVSNFDLVLWRLDDACTDQGGCVDLNQDILGAAGGPRLLVHGLANRNYFFAVDSPSGTTEGAYTIEVVPTCDPLGSDCETGTSCRYNGVFYECSADGTQEEIGACFAGTECGPGLDCLLPAMGSGLCYAPCALDYYQETCPNGTCAPFGDPDDNVGLCESCPTECSGTTPVCSMGLCRCDETSCGEGFGCVDGACVASCDPLESPTTCTEGQVCSATFTEGLFVCRPPGTKAGGFVGCGGPGTCVDGYECDQFDICSAWCALDGSLACGGGERCDAYRGDSRIGTCRPCPLTLSCDTACCADNEVCDAETTTCVEAPPLANDTCSSPTPLTLATPVTGSTVLAADDYTAWGDLSPTCNGRFEANDVVFSYTPEAVGGFTITVTPDIRYRAVLWYSKDTCGAAECVATEAAETTGSVVSLTVEGEAGATYYIVVDGQSAIAADSNGTFSIRVD